MTIKRGTGPDTDREVEVTLGCYDSKPPLESGPHFMARLEQRLQESERPGTYRLSPVYRIAFAVVAAMVLANVVTLYASRAWQGRATSHQQAIESLIREYTIIESDTLVSFVTE